MIGSIGIGDIGVIGIIRVIGEAAHALQLLLKGLRMAPARPSGAVGRLAPSVLITPIIRFFRFR